MSEDKNRKKSIFRRIKRDRVTDTPSNPTTREDEIGYSAYTSPVENGYAPYSPQTPSLPSLPSDEDEQRSKAKKTGIAKFFAIGLVAVALIVISSFATYLFSHYDFQLSSGNGVIKFSLIPRNTRGPQAPPSSSPDLNLVPATSPLQTVPIYSSGGGAPSGIGIVPGAYSPLTLQQIYKKCAPSVVSVNSDGQNGPQSGSGIIVSDNGFIITNQHIIYNAFSLSVILQNGSKYGAAIVGEDEQTDIAILKIDASGLTPAEFADSASLEVGDSVVAIGNMTNQGISMTDGIITAINRNINFNGLSSTLLQTNASVSNGNSGGPLINRSGQVVGMLNSALFAGSSPRGISFAVPMTTVKPIVDALLKDGYVKGRPSLGLRLSDIAVSAYAFYKLPKGVYVSRVYANSDAYAKGVQPGDVISAANNVAVASLSELNGLINSLKVGDTVSVKLYRNGSFFTADIKLMDKAEFK